MIEERTDGWLSTREAAERLGLTPGRVRELIVSGALPASRIGNRYVLRREDVEERQDHRPGTGRPYSPRRAWALILLASGLTPPGIDPVTLSKLRRLLRERDFWSTRSRFAARAERRDLRAHSSDLARLEAEPDLVMTGPRVARAAGLDLVAPDAALEAYVDEHLAHRLTSRYRLRPADRPNVVLRVVPPDVWAELKGRPAPAPAVALDVAEDRDPRSQAAARVFLARK